MRVLHAAETTIGGVGVFVEALARDQAGRGHDVFVAVPSAGGGPARIAAAGARHLPWEAVPQPGPGLARELRELRAAIAESDPEILHLHSSKAGMAGRLLVRGRRPTVMQPHAWSFLARGGAAGRAALAWERMAARWASVVLCVGEGEREVGKASGIRADFRVIPNGVDLERFPPVGDGEREAARGQLGLGSEPLAVCVGRLHRQKNQRALLDAWPAVRAAVPGARLALLGDGPDREELEALSVDGVELRGQVADVRSWLVAANVVAMPSRWEGLSLSLLEALACGRSVVATDVPGMREAIEPGAGALVPQDSPDALAAALAERLADPGRADAEGATGRRRVEERHDRRAQHAAIDALYSELAAPIG